MPVFEELWPLIQSEFDRFSGIIQFTVIVLLLFFGYQRYMYERHKEAAEREKAREEERQRDDARLQREARAREDARKQAAEDRRNELILAVQRLRLAEANLAATHHLEVISATHFVSSNLQLSNIGDGPVDFLCALMSARMLDESYRPGIGKRGRNVEWEDHRPFYWNDPDVNGMFPGLSTTKSMMISADHYLRLAANASEMLRRKDAINNQAALQQNGEISLKYRAFVVARGYPLGEIWRQLGGRPPDLLESVDPGRLQFRALARPNYFRWRCVQEALLNLNRLVFRLALEKAADVAPEATAVTARQVASDPLGMFTTPDAWRFFLLRHMEFVDLRGSAPNPNNLPRENVTALLEDVTQEIKQKYLPDLIVPDDFMTNARYQAAKDRCYERLQHVLASWDSLMKVIEECRWYHTRGYAGCFEPIPIAAQKHREHESDDGYPLRIHTDRTYRDLWLYYLREGYLISKPFPREGRGSDSYDEQDIPDDPRDLEPYVMLQQSLDATLRLPDLSRSASYVTPV